MEYMEKLRDGMRQAADMLDEFISLDRREKNGEDVKEDYEGLLGRFVIKMSELQRLQSRL